MREHLSFQEPIIDGSSDGLSGDRRVQPDLERSGGVKGLKSGGGSGEIPALEDEPAVDPVELNRYGAAIFAMTSGEYASQAVARFLELHQQRTEDLRAAQVITDLSVIDSSTTDDFPITVEKTKK